MKSKSLDSKNCNYNLAVTGLDIRKVSCAICGTVLSEKMFRVGIENLE